MCENVCKYIFMNHTQSRISIYGDFKAFSITSCIGKDTIGRIGILRGFVLKVIGPIRIRWLVHIM